MGLLINIDNGGTFTDVCVRDDGEQVFHAKSATTPHDLTQCFVDGLSRASEKIYGEADLPRLLRETDYLRYSTTAGTNAVVERRGTPAALIVEKGAEEDAYGARAAIGDEGFWRALVQGSPNGLSIANDTVDVSELTAAVNRALATGARRLVIALRSEAAERSVKDLLLEKYPRHLLGAVPFLLSYELIADEDHARRTTTALINSYLHPGMEHFLYGADRVCKSNRLARPLLIFRNDGDSARVAKTTAVKTWGSGPRGGLEGTIAYAQAYNSPVMVAMDIGGTTTDVAVALNGAIGRDAYGEVEGARISFPLPIMQSYGLGGSSVIRLRDGDIVVGPQSVGAVPGPACFGRGGSEVTLTDALLLAGIIDGSSYLGGTLKLDADRAAAVIDAGIAGPLGIGREEAVSRIIKAFANKVAEPLVHSITAAGHKPEEATLLAFGGGGPMIASMIANAAGIRRLIVPHMASVFSAFGIGFSHLAQEYHYTIKSNDVPDEVRGRLLERARRDMEGEGVSADRCTFVFYTLESADGQLVERPLPDGSSTPAGTVLCLRAVHDLPTFSIDGSLDEKSHVPSSVGEAVVLLGRSEVRMPIYSERDLRSGHTASGPCLIRGDYLTFLIEAEWRFRLTRNLDIILENIQ